MKVLAVFLYSTFKIRHEIELTKYGIIFHMTNLFTILTSYNLIVLFITLLLGLVGGFIFAIVTMSDALKRRISSSLKMQRSVLGGQFSEHLAPYLPGFPNDLKPSEAKFLGAPVDFIVFKGLDDKNITEVVFVEVKTGRARFNENEKSLREAIEQKRVRYISYFVPDKITK